ncbi:hypothetical protein ACWEV3_03950 [Saccharopolyspora sp. NPDC003752]
MARREAAIREKTLYRMLYETAARAEEILGLNIEDPDLTPSHEALAEVTSLLAPGDNRR